MVKIRNNKKITYLTIFRNILVSLITFILLIWSFWNNKLFIKILIIPFIVCSLSSFANNLFLLLNKPKIANIFIIIFKISILSYMLLFLVYAFYFSILNKSYSLLIIIFIFLFFIIKALRKK